MTRRVGARLIANMVFLTLADPKWEDRDFMDLATVFHETFENVPYMVLLGLVNRIEVWIASDGVQVENLADVVSQYLKTCNVTYMRLHSHIK